MIASWILLGATLLGAADTAGDFEAFFKEFTAQRAAVKVLDATFTQTTVVPEETITTQGTLNFAQPRRFVIRTEDPKRETLLDHRRGYEYEADLQQVLIFDMDDNPEASIFFLGFDDDTAALREAYDVKLFDTPGEAQGPRGLVIRPKATDENPLFMEVSLYLREGDLLPYRIRIENDEESTVTLEISNFKVNAQEPFVAPDIQVPEGTKIIENDQVIETVGPGGKRLPDALPLSAPASTSEDLPPAAPIATSEDLPPVPAPLPQAAPVAPTP